MKTKDLTVSISKWWKEFSIKEFTFRYQIPICVTFGMFGFILSSAMLINRNGQKIDGQRNTPYGEVIMTNKKPLVLELIQQRIDCLNDTIKILSNNTGINDTEKTERKKLAQELSKLRQNSYMEKDKIEYRKEGLQGETYAHYLEPDRKKYLEMLRSTAWKNDIAQVMEVPGFIIDTVAGFVRPIKYQRMFSFKQDKRANVMEFILSNPKFGLWMVLTIAQMMLWFLLIPLLMGNVISVQQKYGDDYQVSIVNVLTNSIVPFIFVGIFCIFFYWYLVDDTIISDAYFFTGYNKRMFIYGIFGYLVVCLCFGSYLSLARRVDKKDSDNMLKMTNQEDEEKIKERYKRFKKAFDNAFLASAVILSFFVIWNGVTINAINSLENINFYGIITGRKLLSEDFPYLLGLIHTCILLTFYLPVKLKFDSMELADPPDRTKPVKSLFDLLSTSLGTILVTASPLLASLVQGLVTALH